MSRKYKLQIHPFAELDLEDLKNYYDLKNEELGEEFVAEVKKTIKRIEENPYQFPKEKQARKALVKKFPFIIFFYIKELLIVVFAIFHTSRNPKKLNKRLN